MRILILLLLTSFIMISCFDFGSDNSDNNKTPDCADLSENAEEAVENFEARQDSNTATNEDCQAAVAALEAFANCLPDGDDKDSVLLTIKQLEQICKDIK